MNKDKRFQEEVRIFLNKLYEVTYETSHSDIESLQQSIEVEVNTFLTKVENIDEELLNEINPIEI